MDTSFLELKSKQVINTVDGKCLGHITDVVFDVVNSKCKGFVVPLQAHGFWSLFKGNRELFIPFECVCKFGVDVILIELYIDDKSYDKYCEDEIRIAIVMKIWADMNTITTNIAERINRIKDKRTRQFV